MPEINEDDVSGVEMELDEANEINEVNEVNEIEEVTSFYTEDDLNRAVSLTITGDDVKNGTSKLKTVENMEDADNLERRCK